VSGVTTVDSAQRGSFTLQFAASGGPTFHIRSAIGVAIEKRPPRASGGGKRLKIQNRKQKTRVAGAAGCSRFTPPAIDIGHFAGPSPGVWAGRPECHTKQCDSECLLECLRWSTPITIPLSDVTPPHCAVLARNGLESDACPVRPQPSGPTTPRIISTRPLHSAPFR